MPAVTPQTYYIYFHSGDFVAVPNSQPPTLVDEVIKAGYYRDLDGNAGNVETETPSSEVRAITSTPSLLWVGPPTVSGIATTDQTAIAGASRTFFGATSDDILHVAPRALEYTKSAWEFKNAAGDLLARPLYEDVRCFSPCPPNTLPIGTSGTITAVTPSDSTTFEATNYIYASGSGNLALLLADGVTSIIIPVVAGTTYHMHAIKIKATGTTATGILRW